MPISEKITSLQNPRVKEVVRLHRSKDRRESGLIIVEGFREIRLAIESGFKTEYLMVCPVHFQEKNQGDIKNMMDDLKCFEVNSQVFAKMAYRDQSDGLLAVMHAPEKKLTDIVLSGNPLIIVLEAVEKPGNLGAILRTADAAGVDAVVICDPLTDIYNPNVIRSSIGCVFTTQLATCTSTEALQWLKLKNIEPFAAALTAKNFYHQSDFRKPLAFVMGAEADGLSDFWLENTKSHIKIPMLGSIDSLNVSTSAAVLVYEAVRQRST
jgi:RNA methyltransferase, TrmH family